MPRESSPRTISLATRPVAPITAVADPVKSLGQILRVVQARGPDVKPARVADGRPSADRDQRRRRNLRDQAGHPSIGAQRLGGLARDQPAGSLQHRPVRLLDRRAVLDHPPRDLPCVVARRGAEVRASRTWTGLAGSGRMALIDHRDAAEAAVRVLTDPALWSAHHDLTGPVPMSWPEAFDLLSAELAEPVTFQVAAQCSGRPRRLVSAVTLWFRIRGGGGRGARARSRPGWRSRRR